MCGPPAIVAIATVASTAFQVTSQVRQGRFQKATADYNARVADNKAQEVRRASVEEENIKRRETAELLAKQRAQLGAANVELTSGSPLELQQDTVTLGEADALRIRSNFESRALSLGTGADLTRSQGGFAESAGTNLAIGSLFSGTASALGTGVADKWFTPNSAANQPLTL